MHNGDYQNIIDCLEASVYYEMLGRKHGTLRSTYTAQEHVYDVMADAFTMRSETLTASRGME